MKPKLLITGGTGFLGRGLAMRFSHTHDVVLCGRNNAQNEYAQRMTGCEVVPADVASIDSLRDVFDRFRPTSVIHAAASKFVGIAEKFPNEAIDVNIIGSQNVARLAIDKGVETVVAISTDKAAPPHSNLYAMTKGVMERLYSNLGKESTTNFASVRFGNIAWSSGSVFPIWREMQTRDGGLIRTTGYEMRRFFITRDEAVTIVEDCFSHAAHLRSKVITRRMPAVEIKAALDVWVHKFGGRWEKADRRPEDSDGEAIIGESEVPFTEEISLNNNPYLSISPGCLATSPVDSAISTANSELASAEAIALLLDSRPTD